MKMDHDKRLLRPKVGRSIAVEAQTQDDVYNNIIHFTVQYDN